MATSFAEWLDKALAHRWELGIGAMRYGKQDVQSLKHFYNKGYSARVAAEVVFVEWRTR